MASPSLTGHPVSARVQKYVRFEPECTAQCAGLATNPASRYRVIPTTRSWQVTHGHPARPSSGRAMVQAEPSHTTISDIFSGSDPTQVVRIDAGPIATQVVGYEPSGRWTNQRLPRKPMSTNSAIRKAKPAISVPRTGSGPFPAVSGTVNEGPEPLDRFDKGTPSAGHTVTSYSPSARSSPRASTTPHWRSTIRSRLVPVYKSPKSMTGTVAIRPVDTDVIVTEPQPCL